MALRTCKVVRPRGAGTRWEDINWLRNLPDRVGAVGILTYGDPVDEDTFSAHVALGNIGAMIWDELVHYVVEDEVWLVLAQIQRRDRSTLHIAQLETIWIREVDGGEPPLE